MMRVAHLLLGAADQVAGIQKYIASLKGEYACVVINQAPQYEKYLRKNKIKFYVYKNTSDLVKKLKEQKITVLHCHLGKAAWVGWLVSWHMPVALVYTQHFIQPAYTASNLAVVWNIVFKFIFRRFKKIIAISDVVAQSIMQRKEVARNKIAVICNGIAIPRKKQVSPQKRIVMICRMQKEKQPELVIALAKLLPEYVFDVLGAGVLLNELRKQAPQNCHFVGFQENVDMYLKKAQFLFMPAPAEPFGYVFLEALRAGVPVLATTGGAAREILNMQCALFFERETLPALAKKIRAMGTQRWQKMSTAAYMRAQYFSLDKMKQALREVYAC